MKYSFSVAPADLRDFAKSRGWILVAEAIEDRLYVLRHPLQTNRQLVFPIDITAPDYFDAIGIAVEKLAQIEELPSEVVWSGLQEAKDDTLRFRIGAVRNGDRALPLAFASAIMAGAQQLLLSAACTVLKPQACHPRLNRAEAQQLLEASHFRHTEPGSFVFKVSCPVNALDVQTPLMLGDGDTSFVRHTTLTLYRSLRQIVTAIEADTLPNLVEQTRQEASPLVSSNLCEALTRFQDEALKNSLDLTIAWSIIHAPPTAENTARPLRFQPDYFPRIEEVRRALRSVEKHNEDTFIGTVERLDGEMGADGRRTGEVILALLLPEGEIVRARTNLDAEQYVAADEAHMTEGAYVRITGKLHPGRQPRALTDVAEFKLLSKN